MKFHLLSLITLGVLTAGHVGAADSFQLDGKDITPVVNYYRQELKVLTTPVTVYSWSQGGNESPFNAAMTDQQSAEQARYSSYSFWGNYGSPQGDQNMYGFGLYTSTDVVATNSFGSGSTWLLLEMKLPVGFRMLDLGGFETATNSLESQAAPIMSSFKCPGLATNALFTNGGKSLTAECQRLSVKVFNEILHINGFAYSYSDTSFKDCPGQSWQTGRAIVITSPEWIQAGMIHYYNEKSTEDLQGRILIQTLFLKSVTDKAQDSSAALESLKTYLIANPDFSVQSATTRCDGDYCIIRAHLCDLKHFCADLNLTPIRRAGGGLITALEAARTDRAGLLWKDLEGQPKAATVSDWLIKNKFACDGKLPYAPAGDSK